MEKEEYRFLGKKLKMDELLKGFGVGFYDPTKSTCFKWKESLHNQSHGQIAWIRKRLTEWLNMINSKSGVRVVDYRLTGELRGHKGSGLKSWEINFDFLIPGSFNLTLLNPSYTKEFAGNFKMFLAKELLRRFPVTFKSPDDCRYPPFNAGIADMYILKPSDGIADRLANCRNIFFSDEFNAKLSDVLESKYKAKLFFRKDMGRDTRYWEHLVMLIKWDNDTNFETRQELSWEIPEILKELGAKYTSHSSEHAYYRVYFEN